MGLESETPIDRLPHIWVASAHSLADLAADVVAHGADARAAAPPVEIVRAHFDEALAVLRARCEPERGDVVLSAGANGEFLAARLDVPVVAVRVGGFDLMAALVRARKLGGRAAVVLHASVGEVAAQFFAEYGLPIAFRRYGTRDEAADAVRALAREGVEVIVGAGVVVAAARQLGLAGVLIYSADAVRTALDDAQALIRARSADRARAAQLGAVLDHMADGVVALDAAGAVMACNSQAREWVGPALRLQAPVPAEIAPAARTSAAAQGRMRTLRGRAVMIDYAPLAQADARFGTLVTLTGSEGVERAYRRLTSHRRRTQASRPATRSLADLETRSEAMRALMRRCELVAAHFEAPVLIRGETGTGKERVAQGLHAASPRRAAPFVAINCAAFTETLLESELFGYEEGAFTGARREGKPGLFEAADGGVLFLDEIGEMPMALQARLLRVLQEGEIRRIGAVASQPVDVRVLAATHADLRARVKSGAFRQDLYFRLCVIELVLPPLRARPEDLPGLAQRFIDEALQRAGLEGHAAALTEAALPVLRAHAWPGNVRELQAFAERLALQVLERGMAGPLDMASLLDPGEDAKDARERMAVVAPRLADWSREQRRDQARAVLAECGGDRVKSAERLGISRTTLWRLLTTVSP